jgi:hypothetical protein
MAFALNQQNDRHDPILFGFHINFYQPESLEVSRNVWQEYGGSIEANGVNAIFCMW